MPTEGQSSVFRDKKRPWKNNVRALAHTAQQRKLAQNSKHMYQRGNNANCPNICTKIYFSKDAELPWSISSTHLAPPLVISTPEHNKQKTNPHKKNHHPNLQPETRARKTILTPAAEQRLSETPRKTSLSSSAGAHAWPRRPSGGAELGDAFKVFFAAPLCGISSLVVP